MIIGDKDYIKTFKINLMKFLKTNKKLDTCFIFYVIYKDTVKKFIIDFNIHSIRVITEKVLSECLLMALDNNCNLEDLIITEKGKLIII